MEPTEHESITRRLHALGNQPVDGEVASRHRSLMASVPVASSRSRLRPLMVGSLLAGSLLGGMGLAAAAPGVPDSASDVAKTVLATVTLGAVDRPEDPKEAKAHKADDTPEAKAAAQKAKDARKAAKAHNDPAGAHGVTRSTAGCPAGFTGNHGQYVSSVAKDPNATEEQKTAAAESDCGKPMPSVNAGTPTVENDAGKPANPGRSNEDHGQGAGKPAAGTEHGQSDDDHPGDRPNRKAVDSVEDHRRADAGRSAGRGPVR